MGYYCTVPQCTSLAGKTKNVKFHRFPRDEVMADKWNTILKRGKPITKYSKVCSLHFTQADYNVTTMGKNKGQWKTLSKDAVPSQNLPKLNPDGTVMVIRKSRIINKYKEIKKEAASDSVERWSPGVQKSVSLNSHGSLHSTEPQENISFSYRLQAINALANNVSPQTHDQLSPQPVKPKKQDAIMQTDPIKDEEDSQMNTSYETEKSYSSDLDYQYKTQGFQEKRYDLPKDYKKDSDYIPQTNDEYNKEAEKYALERKSHNTFDKMDYQKSMNFEKMPEVYTNYSEKTFESRQEYVYENPYPNSVDTLRNQQQNIQLLQQHHRLSDNQNFFNENHIKQEIEFNNEEDKFLYEHKSQHDSNPVFDASQRMQQVEHQVKQEPEANSACDTVPTPQESPYYNTSEHNMDVSGCYSQVSRPGPELLIAKQNALAAHTQLWQNTMKRPFFYSENPRYNTPPIIHRYEDLSRILQ
ncbi:uncharacterized protein LOC121727208 isoform X2 [Aricia agestis]|uniref:uncharacterized protein LOC121727208 isoform X2 n=1 Tax=Aricia agestis TaxID=91739 RepID=UPI001C201FB6|nr:uncharacterized protein LOC121727208 isoform X2 [Aricia agestis]